MPGRSRQMGHYQEIGGISRQDGDQSMDEIGHC
jgi:hypothetical protein